MGTEPDPEQRQNRPGEGVPDPAGSDRLQQFYDESANKEQSAEADEESLFAELYGKQEDVKDMTSSEPQDSEAKPEQDEDDMDTDDSDSEEEESEDDADQDVKIILMSSSDAVRPPAGRVAPNKYIRQETPAATTTSTPAAPMMSTDGDMVEHSEAQEAADTSSKSAQRAIAKMIPEKPDAVDSNGQHITFPSVYDVDIDALPEKPWKNPMADPSDWFNYGFDEDSWRTYCQRQVQMRLSVTKPRKQKNPDHAPGAHHHRKHGPITASVPPPHRPPQPMSQDVLQLGGGSNFSDPSPALDPRNRFPPRYDVQHLPMHHHPQMHHQAPPHHQTPPPHHQLHHPNKPPIDHRTPPSLVPMHDPGRPPIGSGMRRKEPESPSDPRVRPSPPPPRHPSPPRHDNAARVREESRDHSRSRFEPSRHSSERRDPSLRPPASSGYEKRGRPSPPRESHYDSKHREVDRRARSPERDHRRDYDRREASYREKRPRSPLPSSRDYDAKRRR